MGGRRQSGTRQPLGGRGGRHKAAPAVREHQAPREDLEDLAAVTTRRDEPTVAHEDLVRRLHADGVL